MAYRDRSQGFGFIYWDIQELLNRREEVIDEDWQVPSSVPSAGNTSLSALSLNFNKSSDASILKATQASQAAKNGTAPAADSTPAPVAAPSAPRTPEQQIRENLDRLQQLHRRLHAMLEEIQDSTQKKKR